MIPAIQKSFQAGTGMIPSLKKTRNTRIIPHKTGVKRFPEALLKEISQKSCGVLKEMGSQIEWVQSYVAENKIYCIYRAENKELIKEHAKKGGFPANSISEVSGGISPATAGQ